MELPAYIPRSTGEALLYFCDESHIRTSDFMAVGGLAVRPERATKIEIDLKEIKRSCGVALDSEIKWSKCKKRYKSVHAAYIDYMFGAISRGEVHLHIRLSPFKAYDHNASGDRLETDTISKAFYQLLLHRAGRYYGKRCRILVRPDAGDCTAYLPKILEGVNTAACSTFRLPSRPFVEIAPRDSKKEPLLQLLDVTLGALTSARNGNHLNGRIEERKRLLVTQALELGKVKDIEKSDPRERRDFNIWNVVPMWKKGAIPTR